MTSEISEIAKNVAQLVSAIAEGADNPAVIEEAFKGNESLQDILRETLRLDEEYGDIAALDGVLSLADADVVQAYADVCVRGWNPDFRPSLPAIAVAELNRIHGRDFAEYDARELSGLDKAAVMVAARAEMIKGEAPTDARKEQQNAYHNGVHTGHVGVAAGLLSSANNALVAEGKSNITLTPDERLVIMIAAFAHDIDHGGGANPAGDIYHFEEKSFEAAKPLLEACDLTQNQMEQIHSMIRTTSPNGPHSFLKSVAKFYQTGEKPDITEIDPDNKFPELHQMAKDERLVQMAAILSDSDLFGSAATKRAGNRVQAQKLTKEMRSSGIDVDDFATDKSLTGFANFVMGEGFTSYAGQAHGNHNFITMLAEAKANLALGDPPVSMEDAVVGKGAEAVQTRPPFSRETKK